VEASKVWGPCSAEHVQTFLNPAMAEPPVQLAWPRIRLDLAEVTVVMVINQSNYFIVRRKVDQRAGQISLPHLGIAKTGKNGTETENR